MLGDNGKTRVNLIVKFMSELLESSKIFQKFCIICGLLTI